MKTLFVVLLVLAAALLAVFGVWVLLLSCRRDHPAWPKLRQ